jgi:hypothetical protein
MASLAGATLEDIVRIPIPVPSGQEVADLGSQPLGPFSNIRKNRFHLDQEHSVEADLYAVSERDDGLDLVLEVKDWQREVTPDAVRRFVEAREALNGHLERQTAFLFYSESGLGEKSATLLAEAGILVIDPAKLASFEVPGEGRSRGGRSTLLNKF